MHPTPAGQFGSKAADALPHSGPLTKAPSAGRKWGALGRQRKFPPRPRLRRRLVRAGCFLPLSLRASRLRRPPTFHGWILIDRCGKHFGTILNYLRDGAVPLPESRREIEELLAEAKYYLVQGLVEECQAALQNKDAYEPFCKVPVITSSKEEQKLIATSNKPAVKLLYNRSNNKYSYTSNSDDNMLKNIELFDKLSLRFNGRVLFIKDVIGDEICCWSFYGQGRKIAEVCCTSIVYATEKKQTKVEFPEARIYEETLNILLYEAQDGRGPDNALLEATGGAAGRSHHLDEDEERERERIERVRRIHIKRPDDRAHLHQ
uniref:Potassium channel tetramerization domain containing 10 n=1 Tax=Equus caballus TaxID=9796 RepID=F7D8S4_HORSE